MEENRFWLRIWTVLIPSIALVIIAALFYDYKKDVRMAELGFQKVAIVGNANTFFQKILPSRSVTVMDGKIEVKGEGRPD